MLEITRAIGENSDNLRYAWWILTQGTCDGCSLGTKGMRDWTLDEVHLGPAGSTAPAAV
jgi:hypothetical protein